MSDIEKLREEMLALIERGNRKRMEIGACLFSPSRYTYNVHNAKNLAALATELVEIASQTNWAERKYYEALL